MGLHLELQSEFQTNSLKQFATHPETLVIDIPHQFYAGFTLRALPRHSHSLRLHHSLLRLHHSLGTPTHPFAGIVGHSTCHTRGRDILSWKMLRALLQFTWQASAADPNNVVDIASNIFVFMFMLLIKCHYNYHVHFNFHVHARFVLIVMFVSVLNFMAVLVFSSSSCSV